MLPTGYVPLAALATDDNGPPPEQKKRRGARRRERYAPTLPTVVETVPLPPTRSLVHSVCSKLHTYAGMLAEPNYRHNLTALAISRAGCGFINSGYMLTLDALGRRGQTLDLLMMARIGQVEDLAAFLTSLPAHAQRDDEDLRVDGDGCTHSARALFSRQMVRCGLVEMACMAALVGASLGYQRAQLDVSVYLAVILLTKGALACKAVLEYGFWGCLKVNLGDATARRQQKELKFLINAIEIGVISNLTNLQTVQCYLSARRDDASATLLLQRATQMLVGGALLAALPRLFFYLQARRAQTHVAELAQQV